MAHGWRLSTWAGVRPVVSDGAEGRNPSDEKREHALWVEPGCVTLAGGKLTTFRLLALEVLQAFHAGRVIRQHNLFSTATEEEQRATLHRVFDWWNYGAVPLLTRLEG